MGFLRSKKGSIISDYFCAADDIGPFSRGDVVEIALYANHLELTEKSVGKKAAAVALPYTRITGVVYRSEVRTAEKDKSPVKRAVVGGILFGSTGAAVGAISGLGKKEVKHRRMLLILSGTSIDGQVFTWTFQDTRLYKGPKVASRLRKLCGMDG